MKKIFYTLFAIFLAYLSFFGYRIYKNKVDSIFVSNLLKLNKNHYSKIEKILDVKNEFEENVKALKNDIQKLEKEIEELSKKKDKEEDKKETEKEEKKEQEKVNENSKNNSDNFMKISENKKKILATKGKLVDYEKGLDSLNLVFNEVENGAIEIHSYVKKCQLGFISNKVKNEVLAFIREYEEKENDLDKKIDLAIKDCGSIREKYSPKEEKKDDVKKETENNKNK